MRTKALVLALILLLVGGCVGKRMQTQEEAEKLAMTALVKYAEKEKIPLNKFKQSQMQKTYFDKDVGVWAVYYETEGTPRHRVNILVDQFGNTELHREVE